nr:MAG TPA_asm: hypothetical protein [Caudoviricetes sp.]
MSNFFQKLSTQNTYIYQIFLTLITSISVLHFILFENRFGEYTLKGVCCKYKYILIK